MIHYCGRGSMVELELPKLTTRVRFPSPAPWNPLNARKSINETAETGKHPRSHIKKAPYGALMMLYFAAPMRQMVVPQSGHLPLVMGLPFLVTPSTGSCISFLALHFTQ